MARGQSVEVDLETAHRLKAQGIPTAKIARQLKVPLSTLKDHLKRALPVKTTDVYNGSPTEVEVWQRFAGKWATGATGQKPCAIIGPFTIGFNTFHRIMWWSVLSFIESLQR